MPPVYYKTPTMKKPKINPSSPWWVIILKVLAYAIGLILAALGLPEAADIIQNIGG